ncbi:REC8 meiotic recombination protein b isoform X4 [Hoplias malabaricus]|uniref:REC8 meiotic recombination protein b isoform X4 n=1 Tax=Hoplias malabaricus TaxID=27720 RepID=UPI0034622BA3
MFYYPNVLQRHTGCFSTVWLAATKGIKLTRREFLNVSVRRTCEDIIDYVQVQVPAQHPSLPRPRFSLYLSSQLQYGVVVVYHRQCAFLLDEVQQTIGRLLRTERQSQIDMQELDRLALNLPDSLSQFEETEGALAPFFGKMGAECELPSPYQLPQPWQFVKTSSPDRFLEASEENIGLNAFPGTITMKDKEPVTILQAEFGGAELPEATGQEIDMLLKQQDQFLLGEVEAKKREKAAEVEKTTELDAATVSVDHFKDINADDKIWNIELTPPPVIIPSTTEASERDQEQDKETGHCSTEIPIEKEGVRRSRKRQLIFADQHTQISQDAMREQINNPMSDVLIEVWPTIKFASYNFFSSPCNSFLANAVFLNCKLQSLWKQCCVLATLPDPIKKGSLQEDSEFSEMEIERGVENEEEWRKRESSREMMRESAEAGLLLSEVSAASDMALDVSKGDRSHNDLITPTSKWSPVDEAAVRMEAILEERVEIPEVETDITSHSLLKRLNTHIGHFGKVSFHALLPPEADRSIAAKIFYKLLEFVCMQKLSVNQMEPYGPITIYNGQL